MTTATGIRGLLDTSVVADYRDGWPAPVQFFTSVRLAGFPEFSEITALALLAEGRLLGDALGNVTLEIVSRIP